MGGYLDENDVNEVGCVERDSRLEETLDPSLCTTPIVICSNTCFW